MAEIDATTNRRPQRTFESRPDILGPWHGYRGQSNLRRNQITSQSQRHQKPEQGPQVFGSAFHGYRWRGCPYGQTLSQGGARPRASPRVLGCSAPGGRVGLPRRCGLRSFVLRCGCYVVRYICSHGWTPHCAHISLKIIVCTYQNLDAASLQGRLRTGPNPEPRIMVHGEAGAQAR